jgi:hypothetical protein
VGSGTQAMPIQSFWRVTRVRRKWPWERCRQRCKQGLEGTTPSGAAQLRMDRQVAHNTHLPPSSSCCARHAFRWLHAFPIASVPPLPTESHTLNIARIIISRRRCRKAASSRRWRVPAAPWRLQEPQPALFYRTLKTVEKLAPMWRDKQGEMQ